MSTPWANENCWPVEVTHDGRPGVHAISAVLLANFSYREYGMGQVPRIDESL